MRITNEMDRHDRYANRVRAMRHVTDPTGSSGYQYHKLMDPVVLRMDWYTAELCTGLPHRDSWEGHSSF